MCALVGFTNCAIHCPKFLLVIGDHARCCHIDENDRNRALRAHNSCDQFMMCNPWNLRRVRKLP